MDHENPEIKCFLDEIVQAWPESRWQQFNVVVAVSGGSDSVALLRGLHQLKKHSEDSPGELLVAHFNHKMRNADSDRDATFVEALCKDLGLRLFTGEANEEGSSENEFREARYSFLFEVAKRSDCRYVVTAHHREDLIETILFRLFRGTGISGLGGIPQTRVVENTISLVRPILNVTKSAILNSLKAWQQPFREDVSNASSEYSRNYIRNELLPLIRERFPTVDDSIPRLAIQANEYRELVQQQLVPTIDLVINEGTKVVIPCEKLLGSPPILIREFFLELFRRNAWPMSQLGFRELDRLASLVVNEANEPLFQLPGKINCQKINGYIHLNVASQV